MARPSATCGVGLGRTLGTLGYFPRFCIGNKFLLIRKIPNHELKH